MMEETPEELLSEETPVHPTLIVLDIIRPEIPALAGEHWPTIQAALSNLLDQLAHTSDEEQQERIFFEIRELLGTVPVLLERFYDELMDLDPVKGEQVTRGNPLQRLQNWLMRKTGRGQMLTRYVDIDCPTVTSLQTPRFSVIVQLKAQPAVASVARVADTLAVQAEKPVQVSIDAPDFALLGPASQVLVLSAHQPDSAPLVFALKPVQVGAFTILLDFWQAGQWLGSAEVTMEVISAEVNVQTLPQRIETSLQTAGHIENSDFTLTITCADAALRNLTFRLRRKTEDIEMDFSRPPLLRSLQDYTREIYRQLRDLLQQVDPTAQAALGVANPLDYSAVEDRLRIIGQNLWRDLIPLELQDLYKRERKQWWKKSLLIISDEPDVPWELLSPYGEGWSETQPLCLLMNLARWLRRSQQVRTLTQPQQQLSLQKLATIVPLNMGLPVAADELMYLHGFAQQHGFQRVSPSAPTYAQVKQFLREESYDWVHIATHGSFYPADPSRASAIWLQDQRGLTPDDIVSEIETAIRRQRAAFLFNACEVGQQGWDINGLAGWASRLIGAGAGLFLAPLWPVQDKTAYVFTRHLYKNLAGGHPIAEAVRLARQEIQRVFKNTTWLAYSLYAHPNATIVNS